MTSEDVIHSFFVPEFRVKQDVLPGRYTALWFQATRADTYHLFCAEYCGTGHSKMIGTVVAMEPADYEAWLASKPARALALQGVKRLVSARRTPCHTGRADARAPNLEGIFNSTVRLQDGRTWTADEGYLAESILDPNAKVVAGYQPIMPTFRERFEGKEDELI